MICVGRESNPGLLLSPGYQWQPILVEGNNANRYTTNALGKITQTYVVPINVLFTILTNLVKLR